MSAREPLPDPDGPATADDQPGDAVCWLHELCPVCGAMPTAEQPDRCWRCGEPLPDATAGDPGEGRPAGA